MLRRLLAVVAIISGLAIIVGFYALLGLIGWWLYGALSTVIGWKWSLVGSMVAGIAVCAVIIWGTGRILDKG